jgi:hypothetical protein
MDASTLSLQEACEQECRFRVVCSFCRHPAEMDLLPSAARFDPSALMTDVIAGIAPKLKCQLCKKRTAKLELIAGVPQPKNKKQGKNNLRPGTFKSRWAHAKITRKIADRGRGTQDS